MKKVLYMALALLVAMTSFTACGDDDDEKSYEEALEEIESGKVKPTVTITEKSNQLVMSVTYSGIATEVHTATFNSDGQLTSYIVVGTYANSTLADAAWKEIQDDPEISKSSIKRDGNVITQDMTSDFGDASIEEIRMVFQYAKAELESGRK